MEELTKRCVMLKKKIEAGGADAARSRGMHMGISHNLKFLMIKMVKDGEMTVER